MDKRKTKKADLQFINLPKHRKKWPVIVSTHLTHCFWISAVSTSPVTLLWVYIVWVSPCPLWCRPSWLCVPLFNASLKMSSFWIPLLLPTQLLVCSFTAAFWLLEFGPHPSCHTANTWHRQIVITMQYHLESLWLTMASFYSITINTNTQLM